MNILFLSFWTPPAVRPRAIAAGKIIPELIWQGVSPVVMTYQTCGEWRIDLPIYKIPEPTKSINKFTRLWNEYRYFNKIFNIAEKIIKKHGINVVFSFSNPQESNILGVLIKKRLGISFVSHFSDPWTDNPYKKFSGLGGWKARVLEKFVVKNSDRIIFTNKTAQDLILKKYSQEIQKRGRVLNHSFKPDEYPQNPQKSEKFVISHIGAFYKERTPEVLFAAVNKISKNNHEVFKKIEIQLVGAENEYGGYGAKEVKELVLKYGLKDAVKIIPVVGYKESLKFMAESDCLVVIDAPFPNSPFLPSKVVDYAGSSTPIIGITPFGSPTSEFLTRLGYWVFENNQASEIAKCLENLISGNLKPTVNKKFLEDFEIKNIVAKLIAYLSDVVKNYEEKN